MIEIGCTDKSRRRIQGYRELFVRHLEKLKTRCFHVRGNINRFSHHFTLLHTLTLLRGLGIHYYLVILDPLHSQGVTNLATNQI